MSKEIAVIEFTGRDEDRDLTITEFAMGGTQLGLQLTQGLANIMDDNDEPGFIQLTEDDVTELIEELQSWLKSLD